MSDENNDKEATADAPTFVSKLPQGRQRFLAHAIEHALSIGRRTPEDFIRHFPPDAIMKGLEHKPNLRGKILAETTGLKEKIATKKSWQSAGDDLRIALDERETDAASVVESFHPDDRVLYLDDRKLWAFLIEGDFWTTSPKKKDEHARSRSHVAFMVERALVDELITHRAVIEGITVQQLVTCLPKSELGKIIEGALDNAHRNAPFTEADLLTARPPSVLVEYVPLTHIYQTVIVKIAKEHGYLEPPPQAAEETVEAPTSEPSDWVEVGGSDRPGEEGEEDEIGEEDFAIS